MDNESSQGQTVSRAIMRFIVSGRTEADYVMDWKQHTLYIGFDGGQMMTIEDFGLNLMRSSPEAYNRLKDDLFDTIRKFKSLPPQEFVEAVKLEHAARGDKLVGVLVE